MAKVRTVGRWNASDWGEIQLAAEISGMTVTAFCKMIMMEEAQKALREPKRPAPPPPPATASKRPDPPPRRRPAPRPPKHPSGLTERQCQVLRLISLGCSAKDIAAILNISFSTADNHRTFVKQSLGIKKNVMLTRFALRAGLTTHDDDLTDVERARLHAATGRNGVR